MSIVNVPTHGDFSIERVAVSNYVSVEPVAGHAESPELQGQLCQTILRDHKHLMARIKTNGAELKKFWANSDPQFWPVDAHVDGRWWQVNGVEKEDVDVENLSDSDVVLVEGVILYADHDKDYAAVMKKWRKAETHVTLAVELPAEHEEALAAFLKGLKGKILGR